jgi:hypothetical protein
VVVVGGGGGGDVVGGGGGGDVVGGEVGGGLVGGGPAGLAGADVGRVVLEEDVLDAGGDVEGTVAIGAELVVRSRLPLGWTVNQLFWKPCPFACDSEWSPALK